MTKRPLRIAGGAVAVLLVVGAALTLWPVRDWTPESLGAPTAFRWDADLLFTELEDEFRRAEAEGVDAARISVDALEAEGDAILAELPSSVGVPRDALGRLATIQFRLAVRGAARRELLARVETFVVRARVATMRAARGWPPDRVTHEALYRVVVGGRIALDEALVQAGLEALPPLRTIEEIPSATPSLVVEGVRIHSGDILLSRGGAPTSALIARGNDFPSTFSHAALAHVDADTGEGVVIESLIEAGSVLTSVEEYLERKSHRILVLRLRPGHAAMQADPLLPHRAAEAMLARVRSGHIPYDFAMAWQDPSAAFCSEIVFHPYAERGVELWGIRSAMSAPGLVRWLSMMGVREFTSLVPSDLELDAQLGAVVEWRNAPALMDYRLDNAITDVLLEEAERGSDLGFSRLTLPAARALKAFSVAKSALGSEPMIPAGMAPSAALRVQSLVGTVHPALKDELIVRAAAYRSENGFEPPYWALVQLARESLDALRPSLAPALAVG